MASKITDFLLDPQDIAGTSIPVFGVLVIVLVCTVCCACRCYFYYHSDEEDEGVGADLEVARNKQGPEDREQNPNAVSQNDVSAELVERENNVAWKADGSHDQPSTSGAGGGTSLGGEGYKDWTQLTDRMGRTFYFNTNTGESRWTDPRTARSHNLPDGWQELHDPATNRSYYYNAKTGESTWKKPAF